MSYTYAQEILLFVSTTKIARRRCRLSREEGVFAGDVALRVEVAEQIERNEHRLRIISAYPRL
jgi:hypothetical protein